MDKTKIWQTGNESEDTGGIIEHILVEDINILAAASRNCQRLLVLESTCLSRVSQLSRSDLQGGVKQRSSSSPHPMVVWKLTAARGH